MKMSTLTHRSCKALLGAGFVLGGTLIALTCATAATKGPNPADPPDLASAGALSASSGQDAASGAIRFPPPVAAVLRLMDAKVDPEVIKAFIRNSNVM